MVNLLAHQIKINFLKFSFLLRNKFNLTVTDLDENFSFVNNKLQDKAKEPNGAASIIIDFSFFNYVCPGEICSEVMEGSDGILNG